MNKAIKSPYLVPFNGSFKVSRADTKPPKAKRDKKDNKERLEKYVDEFNELQRKLYAFDKYAVLLIFQAMDAAGKDGTIRAVTTGVNPAGFQVSSFKVPTPEELDHDYLWRTTKRLPERGRIGIFNRSYYEEVLVVRVHPNYLRPQRLPSSIPGDDLWTERYESIRDQEKHLARNGTVIIKFWLNVSREEQRKRFLDRIEEPEKNWKFSETDVREREHWDEYMDAYEEALNATSRSWAPWYAIPADDKPYMRACVAEIIVKTLRELNLRYPDVGEEERAKFHIMEKILRNDN